MEKRELQVVEEGEGGRNKKFKDISSGQIYTLEEIANNIDDFPGYHVVHRDGQIFIRSNPDGDRNNNLE